MTKQESPGFSRGEEVKFLISRTGASCVRHAPPNPNPRAGKKISLDLPAADRVAARWGITLTDPLLPAARRIGYRTDLTLLAADHPDYVVALLAGVASDLAATLPDDDWWRSCSARVGEVTYGSTPPDFDGAITETGSRFGTPNDFFDLQEPWLGGDADQLAEDPMLAAVADPLPPVVAAVVILAFGEFPKVADALGHLRDQHPTERVDPPADDTVGEALRVMADGAGGLFVNVGEAAVRWLTARRRAYAAKDPDSWLLESVFSWAWRADLVERGKPVNWREVNQQIALEKIHTS